MMQHTRSMSPAPHYSIVIPTYNRLDNLIETMRALAGQADAPAFEVVVVDDGSTDGTGEWLREHAPPFTLLSLEQENKGPAAARNAAVRVARGQRIAFLGDDTVPTPGWLAALHAALDRQEADASIAVIGRTNWHPALPTSPFLTFLNEQGAQFGFSLIQDPDNVPYNFFYTSNLSVPRELVLDQPFDESFPNAAWEDIELGYRLTRRGLRIVYCDRAVTHHRHPVTFAGFAARQERAGIAAVTFFRKHPELAALLRLADTGPPPLPPAWQRRVTYWLAHLTQSGPDFLSPLWDRALKQCYLQGLHRGWTP